LQATFEKQERLNMNKKKSQRWEREIKKKKKTDLLNLVRQLAAHGTTRANDTTIEDDLQECVDSIVHELDTEWAEIELRKKKK
jgi:hypothetical protein